MAFLLCACNRGSEGKENSPLTRAQWTSQFNQGWRDAHAVLDRYQKESVSHAEASQQLGEIAEEFQTLWNEDGRLRKEESELHSRLMKETGMSEEAVAKHIIEKGGGHSDHSALFAITNTRDQLRSEGRLTPELEALVSRIIVHQGDSLPDSEKRP